MHCQLAGPREARRATLLSTCLLRKTQCFGGKNVRYELKSKELDCTTTFTVYYPPAAECGKVPVRKR